MHTSVISESREMEQNEKYEMIWYERDGSFFLSLFYFFIYGRDWLKSMCCDAYVEFREQLLGTSSGSFRFAYFICLPACMYVHTPLVLIAVRRGHQIS